MKVSDIMSKEVVVAQNGATVAEAVRLMVKHKVGCVLVVKRGKAIGIVTERDVLEKVVAPNRDQKMLEVNDIMAAPLITIGPDADVHEAVEKFTENGIKKLPVVKGERLVGIVTATDVIANAPNYLAELAALVLKPTKIVAG